MTPTIKKFRIFISSLICLLATTGTGLAQTSVPISKTIEERIAQLEKEIQVLKRQQ